MSIDNEKFLKYLNIVVDFLTFKINIFPIVGIALYVISIVICLALGIREFQFGRPWQGLFNIFVGPMLSHMVLELFFMFFSMIGLLREIRNALDEKKQ